MFAARGQSGPAPGLVVLAARRSLFEIGSGSVISGWGSIGGCPPIAEKCLFMCAKEEGFLFCVLLCVSFQNLILFSHFAGQNQEDHADRRGGRQGGPGRARYNLYPLQKLYIDCLLYLGIGLEYNFSLTNISPTPRTLELFVESLLTKTLRITNARNAKTLSPSHMKQCIISESRFDFLRDLVKNIPDIGVNEEQLSGSEAGYDPAATPSSSSTTSSNGGGGDVSVPAATPGTSSSGLSLQRSESYTPVTINYAGTLPVKAQIQPPVQQQPPQGNSLKRTLNHVGFYKEISLEETGSGSSTSSSSTGSSREPPPKLTRLHSAPAATITTATKASSSIPFKIDILPTLPAALASSSQPRAVPATAPASSSNFKVCLSSQKI